MLSFDVEDWFQVSRFQHVIPRSDWGSCELRVSSNVDRILALLERHQTRATFFVLGWIAERCPGLVARIADQGHEVASHGYGHRPLGTLTAGEIEADITRAKRVLEDITGQEVIGYRAPDCSINGHVPGTLLRHGFQYDSSLFPSSFGSRYGTVPFQPIRPGLSVGTLDNGLLEVPIATLGVLGRRLPWGGGGYFRFYPYWLFRIGVRAFLSRRSGYLFYGHPWDLDPAQPRVDGISWKDRMLHYGFSSRSEAKLDRLLGDFAFVSIEDGLQQLGLL
jgi:polysaccharide deacetylase family protein (PEP-CTERM system associated)